MYALETVALTKILVEDVTIFVSSDKNDRNDYIRGRDSAGGVIWSENTRGKSEVVCICMEEIGIFGEGSTFCFTTYVKSAELSVKSPISC